MRLLPQGTKLLLWLAVKRCVQHFRCTCFTMDPRLRGDDGGKSGNDGGGSGNDAFPPLSSPRRRGSIVQWLPNFPGMANYSKARGFSLVEAMVATAIVGIGMAGVFMLVSLSQHSLNQSVMREKLQMVANQVLEVVEGDIANIDQYNLDMAVCVDPGAGAATYLSRQYEWCLRMNGEVGAVQAGDTRTVTVTTQADQTRLVHIELEALNGEIEIVMNRSYGVP